MTNVSIKPALFESVTRMAKREGISADKLINEAIERGLEIMDEYDCEAFGKSLDEAREEIKSGKGARMTVEELADSLGVDRP